MQARLYLLFNLNSTGSTAPAFVLNESVFLNFQGRGSVCPGFGLGMGLGTVCQ